MPAGVLIRGADYRYSVLGRGYEKHMIEGLLNLLQQGKDSPELRFGLGNAYLKENDAVKAETHLRECVAQKPLYSAAWKLLGKSLQAQDRLAEAIAAYEEGIKQASAQGDLQTLKEMQVFHKRAQKQLAGD